MHGSSKGTWHPAGCDLVDYGLRKVSKKDAGVTGKELPAVFRGSWPDDVREIALSPNSAGWRMIVARKELHRREQR
jgi:hypothetical protein